MVKVLLARGAVKEANFNEVKDKGLHRHRHNCSIRLVCRDAAVAASSDVGSHLIPPSPSPSPTMDVILAVRCFFQSRIFFFFFERISNPGVDICIF